MDPNLLITSLLALTVSLSADVGATIVCLALLGVVAWVLASTVRTRHAVQLLRDVAPSGLKRETPQPPAPPSE